MSDLSEKNSILSTKLYQNADWLTEQRLTKSIYQIASECFVAPSTIRKYLKKFDIESRSVSEAMKLKYKDNEYSSKKKKQWTSDEYKKKHKEIAEQNRDLKSEISKKLWSDEEFAERTRIAHALAQNETVRQNISHGVKTKWGDEEYREKQFISADKRTEILSNIMKNIWQDEEYKNKMTAQSKQLWKNDEYKKKQQEGLNKLIKYFTDYSVELWSDDEYRQKTTSAIRNNVTEEYKNKISAAMKQYYKKHPEFKELLSKISKGLWKSDVYRQKILDKHSERFTNSASMKHNHHFNYSNVEYNIDDRAHNRKVTICCNDCSHTFIQRPHNHMQGSRCPRCHTSQGQREIYDFVAQYYPAELNNRSIIHPYELDIYVPDHKLAIEFHGLRWHSFDSPESTQQKELLQQKWLLTQACGIRLLQFFDYHWLERRAIVESIISHQFGKSKKHHARKTEFRKLKRDDVDIFFEENHLYGNKPAKHNFGLFDDELLMAISLNGGANLEIVRLATKSGHCVCGGFSKLMSGVTRILKPRTIRTFADLCFSDARGYLNSGFAVDGLTKPGYFYYNNDGRLSRQQCQKHKLSRLLGQGFDYNESESTNMFNNGYRRVWNAGNLKLVKEN